MQHLGKTLFYLFVAFVLFCVLFFSVFVAGCGSGSSGVGPA